MNDDLRYQKKFHLTIFSSSIRSVLLRELGSSIGSHVLRRHDVDAIEMKIMDFVKLIIFFYPCFKIFSGSIC